MIYFTSDLHLGHKNIMKYCPNFRNFQSVDEMDDYLVYLWNKTVTPDDEIYNLGDFSFYNSVEKTEQILTRLNGKHSLVLGNHDNLINKNKDLFKNFILFHYPILEWDKKDHGSVLLYGHLHDNLANIKGRALNVGYDLHGKILSVYDVIEFVKDVKTLENHHSSKLCSINQNLDDRKNLIKTIIKKINQ
ncbi:phosphoesterase [Campylobacter ureolyticus]|uniref:phosphoesterase n=1 Tax=Campylobacter ureolyticus TaxID=827 RepID=UPI0005543D08|nr:phosphoesterase [Campylobacter ureolyticus]